jgi:hypothetical protein
MEHTVAGGDAKGEGSVMYDYAISSSTTFFWNINVV